MTRLMLALVLVLVMFAVIPSAQPGGVDFGREVQDAKCEGVRGTQFLGRAEKGEEEGNTKTFEAVTISFPGAAMILRADKVVYDEDEEVMEVSGNVRLKLDAPSEQVR